MTEKTAKIAKWSSIAAIAIAALLLMRALPLDEATKALGQWPGCLRLSLRDRRDLFCAGLAFNPRRGSHLWVVEWLCRCVVFVSHCSVMCLSYLTICRSIQS